ncbi:hypothetical protein PIROE2DRAFT_15786 [Piromyces sp. E2]|nr:hypothetical protein PIROE2DRAFT_15786 [Piromyces sp. E2]|eukprot:OUM58857.1 hypothetical protein PIROE2DRAFT_15786 [Piromyces sp. E2]
MFRYSKADISIKNDQKKLSNIKYGRIEYLYPKSNILLPIMELEAIIYYESLRSNEIHIPLRRVNVEEKREAMAAT